MEYLLIDEGVDLPFEAHQRVGCGYLSAMAGLGRVVSLLVGN